MQRTKRKAKQKSIFSVPVTKLNANIIHFCMKLQTAQSLSIDFSVSDLTGARLFHLASQLLLFRRRFFVLRFEFLCQSQRMIFQIFVFHVFFSTNFICFCCCCVESHFFFMIYPQNETMRSTEKRKLLRNDVGLIKRQIHFSKRKQLHNWKHWTWNDKLSKLKMRKFEKKLFSFAADTPLILAVRQINAIKNWS